jgi:hypothetical protein
MLETFPDARMVLLTGGEPSWRTWCAKMRLPRSVKEGVESAYRRAEERLRDRALYVDCREITSREEVARRLWKHCLPKEEWSQERWNILRDLNVQVIPTALARRLQGLRIGPIGL